MENPNFAEARVGDLLLSTGGVGQVVRVGRIILIVQGISEAPNQCFTAADAGLVLLDVDVEVQNVSETTPLDFSSFETLLIDAKNTHHSNASYTCSGSPYLDSTVTLVPGEVARGTLAFEVPDGTQPVNFRYEVQSEGVTARWDIDLQS